MIILKSIFLKRFKIFFFLLCLGLSFLLVGYVFINKTLNYQTVDGKNESVPYYKFSPENTGIMFEIGLDKTLFVLNFDEKTLEVVYPEIDENGNLSTFGHPHNYTVSCSYDLVEYMVDCVGGIELEQNGEILRYTGTQVAEKLQFSIVSPEEKKEIAKKIISGFYSVGFSEENFLFITENCETNLNYSDTLLWKDYITELFGFVRFVN